MHDAPDEAHIKAVLAGEFSRFEPLVVKYQARVFSTVRRYARLEHEVEDIVQEVFTKAYRKLDTFRGDAPFEHWLMRLTVRTAFDHLRAHRRNLEMAFSSITEDETRWLECAASESQTSPENEEAARALINRLFECISPGARLVLTLLEIERRSVKEVSELTGWSPTLVKVRAFRARAEMRRALRKVARKNYW